MYYRQKCPQCGVVKEYVYVQMGHHINCKNCNYEFELVRTGIKWIKYVIIVGVLLAAAGLGFYLFRSFYNWWVKGSPLG
jgi:hypothetical protein